MLDTAIGPIDDSQLAKFTETTTTPAGVLVTTKWFHGEQLVKMDQDMQISEAALTASGIGEL
jgi:hypothetical protein